MLKTLFKAIGPVAALAAGVMVAGCDNMNIQIGDSDGVPLAELDMSGPAPTKLVLAGPDTVIVTDGAELDINVSGDDDAVEAMRFSLDDGTLAIMREKGDWKNRAQATVRVTMPAAESVTLAGSGTIEAASLSGDADITIAGSGTMRAAKVDAKDLAVTIAGSGSLEASGKARALELTIAGSGEADMADLKADMAEVTIAGSGDASFASDGDVDASIMGSGSVTVIGRANCTVSSMGSGSLNCRSGTTTKAKKPKAPKAPKAPEAPETPEAPEAPE
ncbi:head GIN domain-containing protein [Qipengyuania marisflavi]|uniref:DUF2807 domain-containing protein n=1 Tax=Qipengyuania marisflavi TaxID=2486356 RepID=A0A5S3P567_9SPHN|nr:head GIN domain-containing protein [Qipengyuania marisflavi]TMM48182.1 DUF2807 domain-containing protein [Qipengyuania marisflavi]